MEKIYKKEVLKWSNLFFLIPLFVAVIYGAYWYAILLLAVLIVSFDFHFFYEANEVYYLDVIFSALLMVSNLTLLFWGHWALPYSITAVVFACIALFFYFKSSVENYYLNHSIWHVFSSGVSLLCLMTFLTFLNLL
jgi:hypothetical protein